MFKRRKQLYLLIILLIIFLQGYGQQNSINTTDVVLEGRIVDSTLINKPNEKRKIRIMISKYPFTSIPMARTKHEIYETEVSYDEKFKFIIPAPAEIFYMHILYYNKRSWSSHFNIYMLERGDRINCNLSDKYFEFSGKGSEKLNCQSEIYKFKYTPSKSDVDLITNKQFDKFEAVSSRKRDSVFGLQRKVVEKYKNILSPSLIETMLTNCFGLRYFDWLRGAREYVNASTDQYNAFLKSHAYKNINVEAIDKLNPKNIAASYIYTDFIFQKILVEQMVSNRNEQKRIDPVKSSVKIFENIEANFSGIIKDKLIALFMLNNSRESFLDNFIERSIQTTELSMYREIYLALKRVNLTGSSFYGFNLEDTKGKMVTMEDFKGKVVFIDFWFTGCNPCIVLKKALQPVIEKFKNNPNVKFISVSSDKDKEIWLKSVKSGKYTDPDGINLYTGGLAMNHPLYKYYNIVAAPIVYLIKDGKIFSSPLPRPLLDVNGKPTIDGNTGKVIALINQALVSFSK